MGCSERMSNVLITNSIVVEIGMFSRFELNVGLTDASLLTV